MGSTARRRLGAVTEQGGGSDDVGAPPLPDPPSWLGDDARAVWERLAPVVPDDKLTAATADGFALLCVALATYEEAHGIIIDTGLLIAQGQELVTNPAYGIRMQQNPVALNLLKTYGLTPDQPPPTKPGRGPRPHLVE
jgi:P27 family predicted phage terminase small subunit